jgi:cell division protein FtsQ
MKLILLSGIIYLLELTQMMGGWLRIMEKGNKKSNELIKKRRKKAIIRRSILIFVLLFAILSTLCLKLSYFNILNISVVNNRNVSSELLTSLSGINIGSNIFYINTKIVKNNVCSNPYIVDVRIKRKLPNKIVIDIQERDAAFYINVEGKKYIILDSYGVVLEERDSINNMKLVKLDGIKPVSIEMGKVISVEDSRKVKVLNVFADLINRNKSGVNIDSIDLSDIALISVCSSELSFKLGDSFDLEKKLNKALNIALMSEVKGKKGYIDLSFDGAPVFNIKN